MKVYEILNGNKLIADFDDKKYLAYKGNSSYSEAFNTYAECEKWIEKNKLKYYHPELGWRLGCGDYHRDWNWIMPVVEKIAAHNDFEITICSVGLWICTINRADSDIEEKPLGDMGGLPPIENIWNAIVQFLKWYNKQPKYKT